jgi:hypothetical protein
MQSLSKNWITESHIDFEYKKYVLLAYLQHVSENFEDQRLYPFLSDLVEHYRNILLFRDSKKNLLEQFPSQLKGADFESFKLVYEKLTDDDNLMKEIESIVEFSIPQMQAYLKEGKKLYDFIEENLKIYPVGILPLNSEAGYLLLRDASNPDTRVYEYMITVFEKPDEKFRGIHTEFVGSYERSLTNTFENIKSDLIRYHKNLPNPATFVIETNMMLPLEETFLPLAKRTIVKILAAKGGTA